MKKGTVIINLFILFFLTITTNSYAVTMSDGDARKFIETETQKADYRVPLGDWTVKSSIEEGDPIFDSRNKCMAKSYFDDILLWEKLGVVEIAKSKVVDARNSIKNKQNVTGENENKVSIKATSKGINLSKNSLKYPIEKWLILPFANSIVTDIVKNEERKIGIDEYRILMAKITMQIDSTVAEYNRFKNHFSNNIKVIFLVKYDNFESKWAIVETDIADQNKDFKTQNVNKALSK